MKAVTRARFLAAHPACCFCAGERPATTIDHQPAKVFYEGKRPPDEAEFPACAQCQDASRMAEQLVSILAVPVDQSPAQFERWLRRLASAQARYPDYFADLVPSDDDVKRLAPQVAKPPPSMQREDMVTVDPALWSPLFQMLARKLGLAWHYKMHGRPLTRQGTQLAHAVPNAHVDEEFHRSFIAVANSLHISRHGSEVLADQVPIYWGKGVNPVGSALCFRLHHSMMIYSIAVEGPVDLPAAPGLLFQPLP